MIQEIKAEVEKKRAEADAAGKAVALVIYMSCGYFARLKDEINGDIGITAEFVQYGTMFGCKFYRVIESIVGEQHGWRVFER